LTEKSRLQAAADFEEIEEVEIDSGGADVSSERAPEGPGTPGGGAGAGGSGMRRGTIGMTLTVLSRDPFTEQDRVAVGIVGVQVWTPAQLNDCVTVVEEHNPPGQLKRNLFRSGSQLVPAGQMNSAGPVEVGPVRVPPVSVRVLRIEIHTMVKNNQ
jgi:hypothetical protein